MEYIKKEDVLKLLDRNSITHRITFADGVSIFDTIKNLPAVEVPEFVMCKDCEYYIGACKICRKLSGLKMTIPEFGCVLGKTREG